MGSHYFPEIINQFNSFAKCDEMEGLKCLQWDSHTAHVRSLLQDLMITNNFSDVTLVCEDQTMLRAHRNILSSGSKVLKDIFLFEDKVQISGQQSVIHFRGVNHAVMQAILEYIYLGETTVPVDGTNAFLLAAKTLGVKDCTEERTQYDDVETNLCNDENVGSFECNSHTTLNDNIDTKQATLTKNVREVENLECQKTQMGLSVKKPRQITIGFNEVISSLKIKEEVDNEIEECPKCDFKSDDKKAFRIHIEFAHDGVKYHCHNCDFKTTVSNELDLHIDSEHMEVDNKSKVKHQCATCGKILESANSLKNHEKNIHDACSRERFSCGQCDYTSYQQKTLKSHVDFVHNNIKFPCEICGKPFANVQVLNDHVMKIHERIQMFACDQCEYKAVAKDSIQKHILAKHEKVELSCDQCDKKYCYDTQLKRHKKAVHEGSRFMCDSCNFQAAYKSDIKTHKKIVHEGIRKKCDECDYQSKHTRELRNHMKKQHQKNVSFKKGIIKSSQLGTAELNPTFTGSDTN